MDLWERVVIQILEEGAKRQLTFRVLPGYLWANLWLFLDVSNNMFGLRPCYNNIRESFADRGGDGYHYDADEGHHN